MRNANFDTTCFRRAFDEWKKANECHIDFMDLPLDVRTEILRSAQRYKDTLKPVTRPVSEVMWSCFLSGSSMEPAGSVIEEEL